MIDKLRRIQSDQDDKLRPFHDVGEVRILKITQISGILVSLILVRDEDACIYCIN